MNFPWRFQPSIFPVIPDAQGLLHGLRLGLRLVEIEVNVSRTRPLCAIFGHSTWIASTLKADTSRLGVSDMAREKGVVNQRILTLADQIILRE